jgi:hypothetical protein
MGKQSQKDGGYARLEARITKNDVEALLARWEWGGLALKERGDNKQLKWGRLDELSNALGRSRSELQARIKFAEQYATEAQVREAFTKYGSWHAICRKGIWREKSTGGWREDTDTDAVHQAVYVLGQAARKFLDVGSLGDRYMSMIINDHELLDAEGDLSLTGLYNGMLELRRRVDCALEAIGKRLAGGGAYWNSGGGLLALIGTDKDQTESRRRKRAVLRREGIPAA